MRGKRHDFEVGLRKKISPLSYFLAKKMARLTVKKIKISLLVATCIFLLMGQIAFATVVPPGGIEIDLIPGSAGQTFTLENGTGRIVHDVLVVLISVYDFNIKGMDNPGEEGDAVDDNLNRFKNAEEGDTTANPPRQICRLFLKTGLNPGKDNNTGDSMTLNVTFSKTATKNSKVFVVFSEKFDNGEHFDIASNSTINGFAPVSLSIPIGTDAVSTRAYNNTSNEITNLLIRSPKDNSFVSAKVGQPYRNSEVKVLGDYVKIDFVPGLPPSGSVDVYFQLSHPAPDDRTTVMISSKKPADWPTPKIICPPVAFANGTIVGSVRSPDDKPVSDTYVSMSTIGGTVKNIKTDEIKTDENGRFKFKVPVGELITFAAGGLAKEIETKIVTADKLDFPKEPPEFIEPGKDCTVVGNYPISEYIEEMSGISHPIPEARAVSGDGKRAVTTITAPSAIHPGKGKWIMTDASGETHEFEGNIYHVLSARIDDERLRSFQKAKVEYEFDFGNDMANREVMIEPKITGPIELIGKRDRQSLAINDSGHASFEFTVRAKKVPPGPGIPFTISTAIYRSRH